MIDKYPSGSTLAEHIAAQASNDRLKQKVRQWVAARNRVKRCEEEIVAAYDALKKIENELIEAVAA